MKFPNFPRDQSRSLHSNAAGNSRHPEKPVCFEIHSLTWLENGHILPKGGEERLHSYHFYFVKTGSGFLKIDGSFHPVADNTIVCLVPGQVCYYKLDEGAEGYRIAFSPDFLFSGNTHQQATSWLDNYGTGTNVAVIKMDTEMQAEVDMLIYAMQKEFANYFLLRAEILSGLLNILLLHFSRKLNHEESNSSFSKDQELVHRFKSLLKDHFISKKLVAEYASDLCVTPNYLNKTVKRMTGFTASHHIQQKIVLEAKRKAIHSNGSMKEIAYFLGFDNLAHFSKFFKNNSGMNFTTFRKSLTVTDMHNVA